MFIILSTVQGQGGHSSSIPFCYIAVSKSAQREAVAILFLPKKKKSAKEDVMYLAGFHTEGAGIAPPLPPSLGNLEIEYGYLCFVTAIKQ